ncbi:MAG: 3-deoxy-manno-octulosonate cytidylyltransferase [Proteobacteria bacterium]|nr:3-deoxy-manno-octulosonate cytidylyltransferase [Pseudomonadota bacterium]
MSVFRVVIPARFASTRLPGKVLRPLAGRPMLQWVHGRAAEAGAAEVLIATDDARIAQAARDFGATAVMTADTHVSGTDRIAQVARDHGWAAHDIVVNVQGDEPLIPPRLIAQVAGLLAQYPAAAIATLAAPLDTVAKLLDPNVVKVVTDRGGRALYFSRAPIPWNRDSAAAGLASQTDCGGARRHLGIYAYRVGALMQLAALPEGQLERRERLEQLRALEHGLWIQVADALEPPGPDVNTADDLAAVARLLQGRRHLT